MTWEQKVHACQSIGDFSLRMRHPGDWYVSHNVERVEGDLLSGGCVNGANTPEVAVERHWDWLTEPGYHVRIRIPGSHQHREMFWNAFMWADWTS